ncbi:MAG: TRAP transporter large permease subunit [Candidatus Eremiobacteraeota bacterium]|nr:TRAP transporter large permease subunit [Candidatus Eremiobacteraeota bacterium]
MMAQTSAVQSASPVSDVFEAASAAYDRVATVVAAATLALMVATVAVQVFFRYALGHPLTWSEELSTWLFAVVIFIGATVSVRRNEAPALRVVIDRLPPAPAQMLDTIGQVIAFAIALAILWNGILASQAMMSAVTPAMQVPSGFPLLLLPVAGFGLSLHFAARLSRQASVAGGVGGIAAGVLCAALIVFVAGKVPLAMAPLALFGAILAGFAIGLPVALVLIGAVMVALLGQGGQSLLIVPETLFTGASNFILMAVPFFMLTGSIMQRGGLAQRLIDFSAALVGRFRGGLLYVDVISSAIFADISGSAVSDTAAIGGVMLPGMLRRGYDPRFATALQAASGTLGVLFPPSIATIIYAWVANESVAEMFLASFVPAFLVVISFCVVAFVAALRHDYPRERAAGGGEIARSTATAIPALLAPIIIIGGVLSGIVTPTEAGVVAVLYTLAVSVIGYRSLGLVEIGQTFVHGVMGTSRVMFILAGAILLSWEMTILQVPQQLSATLLAISHNPLVLLFLLNVLLVVVHGVLETSATLILIVPLVLPIFVQAGISPIQLGIVFLVNSALGLLTPPLGLLLYVAAPITGLRIETLARAAVPFLLTILVDLVLVCLFPQLSLWLPSLFHH